jgi:hypothetical protein
LQAKLSLNPYSHLIVINISLRLTSKYTTMDSSTQKSAADAKSMNDLFELVERKTIQLNEKDKELATKEQQIKVLSIFFVIEKNTSLRSIIKRIAKLGF